MTGLLRPDNAVAAILVLEDGRYVVQLRDNNPLIWFPKHWGCFGGGIDQGETAEEALIRELMEELGFSPASLKYFTKIDFDLGFCGLPILNRTFFETSVSQEQMKEFLLTEGEAFAAFPAEVLLGSYPVSPYDAFALWLHSRRNELA